MVIYNKISDIGLQNDPDLADFRLIRGNKPDLLPNLHADLRIHAIQEFVNLMI